MGSKGSATTKQSYSLPPEFQKAYKTSIDMATAATSKPYEAYQGQLVAGLTPTQLQGISNVNAAQGMALPAIGRGMELTERAAQGITPELYNQFYSPYTRDVADTTFANMMESAAQQRSGLKGGAIQAGAFGGDRAGIAQAEMARQQQLGLGQTMSGIYNQGYGQAMQLAGQQAQNYGAMGQQLAGLGVGAQGSVLQGAQAQMAAGMQQQATDQAQLQAAYEQWMQRQAYPYQQAQFFANIAQGLGAGAGGTSTTSTPGPSVGSQILGGIGAVGSIFSGSDERMKENIEAVGTLNDGQTIYRYNFKGDPKTQIGLLAQEVETRKPDAVAEVSGLKMVNYKDATDQAASMGGLVTPDMQRQNFADGGVPYYPYAALGYVPEGKIGRGGRGIPEAPPAFKDEGLAEDWKSMKPLTEEQVGGLKALADKLGITFDRPEKSALGLVGPSDYDVGAPSFEDEYPTYSSRFASGGVAGRNGYFMGGEPTMEDAMDEAGLAAAEAPEAPSRLLQRESGGDFSARNAQGYVGRAQFGPERLAEAKQAGVVPAEMDAEGFRMNPDVQKEAEAWHFGDINNFIDNSGLAAFEGKEINGVPVTREGMVNVAHLGGKGGLQKFISSGGRYNPSDANGTSLSDYLAMGAGQSGVAGANIQPMADTEAVMPEEPRSRFDLSKLIASEENPSIIETIMGRRLSPAARAAVMNASFAMLAGRSPFMGVNIGEAGKVGMQTYYNALGQERELAKQQADIGRQGYEAQTGRMTAETGRMSAQNQLAALIIPIIRNYMSIGQPVPPQYIRMINAAFPPGSSEREEIDAQLETAPSAQPLGVGEVSLDAIPSGTEETASVSEIPPPNGTETVAPEAQPEVAAVEDELRSIYEKLPKQQNPYDWERRALQAEAAGNVELAAKFRETANEISKADYDRGFFNVPGEGRVPYPYKLEQQLETSAAEAEQDISIKARDTAEEEIQKLQSGFSQKTQTLTGLAEALTKAETGALAELKASAINILNSFGMAGAEEVEQATSLQDVSRYLGEALASNPDVKQNFGPQISNSDIQIMRGVQGSISDLPGANRRVVGSALGKLAWDKEKVRAWTEFSQQAREKKKLLTRSDITKFNMDFSEGKYTDGKTSSDYVKEAIANTPVMGEINWSDPGKARLKEGYKYIVPRGTYPIGTFEDNVVVMWDGEKLVEVE